MSWDKAELIDTGVSTTRRGLASRRSHTAPLLPAALPSRGLPLTVSRQYASLWWFSHFVSCHRRGSASVSRCVSPATTGERDVLLHQVIHDDCPGGHQHSTASIPSIIGYLDSRAVGVAGARWFLLVRNNKPLRGQCNDESWCLHKF